MNSRPSARSVIGVLMVLVAAMLGIAGVVASSMPTPSYGYDLSQAVSDFAGSTAVNGVDEQGVRASGVPSRRGPHGYDNLSQPARASARLGEYRLAPRSVAGAADEVRWPSNHGFDGRGTTSLPPGARIDRYGPETGRFVSPEGVPIEGRALHPGTDLADYHAYEVVERLTVEVGPVRPWFGQPGWGVGGVQYRLPCSVGQLCDAGVLRRLP